MVADADGSFVATVAVPASVVDPANPPGTTPVAPGAGYAFVVRENPGCRASFTVTTPPSEPAEVQAATVAQPVAATPAFTG